MRTLQQASVGALSSVVRPRSSVLRTSGAMVIPSFVITPGVPCIYHRCAADVTGIRVPYARSIHCSRLSAVGHPEQESDDDRLERTFGHALLLCFLASQNRSLFAAKCLVETVISLYRRGYTVDDMKLTMTLATIATKDPIKPVMQDILLAWVALIIMTLQTVGVPLVPEGYALRLRRGRPDSSTEGDVTAQGLEAFVRSVVDRYRDGLDLFRLQLQQSMQPTVEGEPEASGQSPAVAVLQQNTRLVIITLEVVRQMHLPTDAAFAWQRQSSESALHVKAEDSGDDAQQRQSSSSATPFGAVGYIDGFISPELLPRVGMGGQQRKQAVRAVAVRLLMSFNGAALGYLRSARAFVEDAFACYTAGWTADELFCALNDEEFAQSGGVTRFNLANVPGGRNISATLFARWLSLVFMTLAQLGVPHPGATEQVGWAWVCTLAPEEEGFATEAHGVAEFVSSTLRLASMSDEESGGDEEAREAGGRRGVRSAENLENQGEEAHEGFSAGIEDPELLQTSSFALLLSQQISLVRLTRLMVLKKEVAVASPV